jgi:hypothetical protein
MIGGYQRFIGVYRRAISVALSAAPASAQMRSGQWALRVCYWDADTAEWADELRSVSGE